MFTFKNVGPEILAGAKIISWILRFPYVNFCDLENSRNFFGCVASKINYLTLILVSFFVSSVPESFSSPVNAFMAGKTPTGSGP